MKSEWLDKELNKLTEGQRGFVDNEAMDIMRCDSIRHEIARGLRNSLCLDSDFERNGLLHSDEYESLSDDFITEVAYIAAIKRMNNQTRNAQDEIAVTELSNREVV